MRLDAREGGFGDFDGGGLLFPDRGRDLGQAEMCEFEL